MSISGAVKTISTLLRPRSNVRSINTVTSPTVNITNDTQTMRGINEVIIIPSLNTPIVLIYDKKNGTYRLA
ncbi:hypothetical protein [Caldivirga maquilingensis]|nr:hypothetical protein [Caldivirga maquilingensis]